MLNVGDLASTQTALPWTKTLTAVISSGLSAKDQSIDLVIVKKKKIVDSNIERLSGSCAIML